MGTKFTQASTDLDATVGASITAGDSYWSASSYAGAVAAYQQAGQVGADSIGPEIDAIGFPNATQNFTQQAWQLNSQLAAIKTSTQTDALAAQTLAKKIYGLYQQAIAAGQQAAADESSIGMGTVAWVVAGGLFAGLLAGAYHLRSKGRKRLSAGSTRRSQRRTTPRTITVRA